MAIKKKIIKKKKPGEAILRIKYNQYVKRATGRGGSPAPYKAWVNTQYGPILELKKKKK